MVHDRQHAGYGRAGEGGGKLVENWYTVVFLTNLSMFHIFASACQEKNSSNERSTLEICISLRLEKTRQIIGCIFF